MLPPKSGVSRVAQQPIDAGSRRASNEVVARLHRDQAGKLKRYVQNIVRDELEAEDVVQESFARLLKHLEQAEVEQPCAFLYVLARNLALDIIRSHRRRFTVGLYDEPSVELAAPGAERVADVRLEIDALGRALAALPARNRHAFIQRTVLGHSFKDLSRATGVPVSTLEKQVADGLRHCRRALSLPLVAAA
jgi:RNA polymerase sigma-70 factor (ECF subfamily)